MGREGVDIKPEKHQKKEGKSETSRLPDQGLFFWSCRTRNQDMSVEMSDMIDQEMI